MTRDVNHHINAEGVLELLEKLGKLDDMDSVNILFVVPSDVGKRFPEQSFNLLDAFRPDLTDEQVNNLECDRIPGIKDSKKRKLNGAGLATVGDLFRAKAEAREKVTSAQRNPMDFEANRRRNRHQQHLLQLKQYCACLDYRPPNVPNE